MFAASPQPPVAEHAVIAASLIAEAADARRQQQQRVHGIGIESFRKPGKVGLNAVEP